jgi:hypothetical protein
MTTKPYTAPTVVNYGAAGTQTLGIANGSVESSTKKP